MDILNINLNLLKSFLAVYKSGGINKASKALGIAPPAVTHNIKQLEKQLGQKLFITHTKGSNPTDTAKKLYPIIESAFETLSKCNEQLNVDKEIIRLGTTAFHADFYLVDFHREFMKKHPNIELEFHHDPRHDYLTMLEENKIDIAIMQFIKRSGKQIEIFELFQSPMSFFTSSEFAQKNNIHDTITFDHFLQLPFICHYNSGTVFEKLEKAFNQKLNAIKTPSVMTAFDMVINGQGVGIFFDMYLDKQQTNNIVKFRISDMPQPPPSIYEYAFLKNPPKKVSLYIKELVVYFTNTKCNTL